MNLAALPPSLVLAAVFALGTLLGALANWAIYRLAWNPREISPWGPLPRTAGRRTWSDRVPVIGWLGLAREAELHGSGFWIRPLLIELLMGVGFAALCWWEVYERMLVVPQLNEILANNQIAVRVDPALIPLTAVWPTFLAHVVLITLMVAASFIDIDEKIIPDEITVTGTLLGLIIAASVPMTLLPLGTFPNAPPSVGVEVPLPNLGGNVSAYVEPTTLAAPNEWPDVLKSAPNWSSLALGLGCWWLWCFALAPRFWRGRRSAWRKMQIIARRVLRETTHGLLGAITGIGTVGIFGIWCWGGQAWVGLLTALVGLAASGGLVWIVRKVGTAALEREAMGFGDVTLMMMIGTFLGWQACVIVFFVSPFAAVGIGIAKIITQSDDEIPYGPFLCLGALFVMASWAAVWNRVAFAFELGWLMPVTLGVCFVLLGVILLCLQQVKRLFRVGDDV